MGESWINSAKIIYLLSRQNKLFYISIKVENLTDFFGNWDQKVFSSTQELEICQMSVERENKHVFLTIIKTFLKNQK